MTRDPQALAVLDDLPQPVDQLTLGEQGSDGWFTEAAELVRRQRDAILGTTTQYEIPALGDGEI
jgi:hypothetical protein